MCQKLLDLMDIVQGPRGKESVPFQVKSSCFLRLMKKEGGEMHRILLNVKTEKGRNSSCCALLCY